MRTYLAGPMSGQADYNYPMFHTVVRHLRDLGLTIISPAEDEDHKPMQPPAPGAEKPRAHYMREGLNKLLRCQAIYMLPDWQFSKGAKLEHRIAQACGMTIFYAETSHTTDPI